MHTHTIYPANQPVGGVRAVQGEHQGEHHGRMLNSGYTKNANNVHYISEGSEDLFRMLGLVCCVVIVTSCSATAAATHYNRRRVPGQEQEDPVWEPTSR